MVILVVSSLALLTGGGTGLTLLLSSDERYPSRNESTSGANRPEQHTPGMATTPTPADTEKPQPAPPPGYEFGKRRLTARTTFCVNPDGGPVLERPLIDVAIDAVAIWERESEVELPVAIAGVCPGTAVMTKDGVGVIGWDELEGGIIGSATIHDTRGGEQEADVALDPRWPSFAAEQCVQSALLHELGHVLGLGHQDDEYSVMARSFGCLTKLSTADGEAVRFLYCRGAG